jgi:hypothetical protein
MPKAAMRACRKESLRTSWKNSKSLGVRQGIPALNEIHAQLVEPACDEELILQREVDAFPLAAVAKRRVVDVNTPHKIPKSKKP